MKFGILPIKDLKQLKNEGDYMTEKTEDKPLNIWFEIFLTGIKKFGIEYSSVDPLDM